MIKTAGGYVTRYIGMISAISNTPAQISGIETNVSGDLFVFATYYINNASCQAVLLKFSSNGVLLWKKTISGLTKSANITIDTLGNVYLLGHRTVAAGTSRISSFLVKVDTDGNILWQKKETSANTFYYTRLSTDSSGNIYTIGSYNNLTGQSLPVSIIVSKYTSVGDLVFQSAYKLSDTTTTDGFGICTDSSGNIYITGSTSTTGSTSGYIIKLDLAGALLWKKSLGFVGTILCAITSTNEVCVSNGTIIAKLDSSGNYIWQKSNSNGEAKCSDLYIDSLDNIYMAVYNSLGATGEGTRIFKYATDGTQNFQRLLNSSAPTTYPVSLAVDKLGSLFIGDYLSTAGAYLFIFKLTSSGSLTGTYTIGTQSRVYSVNTGAVETIPTLTTSTNSLIRLVSYPSNFKLTHTAAVYRTYMDSSGNIYKASYNLLVKLNSTGAIVWRKTITGLVSSQPQIIVDNTSGTIYFAGKITSGIGVIAFDSAGAILWQKQIAGVTGSSVIGIDFNNVDLYISCIITSNGSSLVKCSTIDGAVAWARQVGSTLYGNLKAVSDGVYFCGMQSISGFQHGWFGKYGSAGTRTLSMSITSVSAGPDNCYGITVDSTGNIYIATQIVYTGTTYYSTIFKCNSAGTRLWQTSIGNSVNGFKALVLDSSDNVYATGDGILCKINSAGVFQWAYTGMSCDRLSLDSFGNICTSISVSNTTSWKLPTEQLLGTLGGATFTSRAQSSNATTSTIASVSPTSTVITPTVTTGTFSIADDTTTTFTKTGMGFTTSSTETFAPSTAPSTVTMKVF
jgi:hypothetical protein